VVGDVEESTVSRRGPYLRATATRSDSDEEKMGDTSMMGISDEVASRSGVHRTVRVTGPLPEARRSCVV
jgi:hypothetical protein